MPRKINEKSLANLTPIKPGEVRNPLGINRKRPWSDRYSQRSEDPIPDKIRRQFNHQMGQEVLPKGSTWADAAVLRRHMEALMDGWTPAAKEIADRIEGKPPQRMEIVGTERKVVTLEVIFRKKSSQTPSE
jgi:hypothetical protein